MWDGIKDYLEKCPEVTPEEGNRLVDSGEGIIHSSRGLRLSDGKGHHTYTAYGVFPGNLRSGARFALGDYPEGTLRRVTLKDIVCLYGFYPDPFLLDTAVRYQSQMRDYSVNFNELIEYAVNCPDATKDKLIDPTLSSAFWRAYYRKVTEQTDRG